MYMVYQDTIAAISTPLGEGGIGIVRLSGSQARSIAEKLFDHHLSHRHLTYGHINDPQSGEIIDEVLICYMAASHTYTREDIVEINCHSGPLVLQRILELLLGQGARLAHPGEFTLRAFLSGRIDLAQAESVVDIVQAKTAASLRLAVQGLKGRLSREIKTLRNELMSILAYLTARIDFPEDEIEERDISSSLTQTHRQLQELIATADTGMVYRQGVKTAIVGRPNVGKSSLLNQLLKEDRSIVTPVPGTTRDTIEEVVNLQNIPFVLIDTAGIARSNNLVEALGVERSRKAIEQADLVLWVIDASEPLSPADEEIMRLLGDKEVLVLANKCDLPQQASLEELPWAVVSISALTGEGIAELEKEMAGKVLKGKVYPSDAALVTNSRHKNALERAAKHLGQATAAREAAIPEDCIAIDLEAALSALGEITGETVQQELLETIFSQFCIGK